MATLYLPPVTDTPAIGTISGNPIAGATSITVTPVQGTFPTPGAGQAFVAILDPNVSGLLDNATTERCIVTVNSSGAWTIPAGLAFNHANGEIVAIVLSTTWLANLLQLPGGTMQGPIAMGSNKITGLAAGLASTDAANVGQLPPATPSVSAAIFFGHSYLTNNPSAIAEPQTQNQGFGQKLAGLFHVADTDSQFIATASGSMIPPLGPSRAGWDAVFQKVLPPTAAGMQSTAIGTPGVPVYAPDTTGQPPWFVDHGINDANVAYSATFTGSIPSAGGGTGTVTITSTTNLSSTGTYLAGRVGGNGIQVGDFIQGAGINAFGRGAQVTAISWNGTITTITVQGLLVLSIETSQTYSVIPGQASQLETALTNCFVGVATRFNAGVVIRSDDTTFTTWGNSGGGGGSWSTQSLANATYGFVGGTGPTNRTTTTAGDQVIFTLPSNFAGGVVALVFIGTSDLDNSGAYVDFTHSTSAASTAANVNTAGQGCAGNPVPVAARFVLTEADAGKTIVATFHVGTGSTLTYDHASFDARYQSPGCFINQPGCVYVCDPVFAAPAIATAIQNAVTILTGTGTVTVGNVANTYQQFGIVDVQTLVSKRSFWLGTSLTAVSAGTSNASITLIAQRTTAQGDQQAPYAGQTLVMPDPVQGAFVESMLVTAVGTMTSYTIGGNTYNAWPCTLTRGYQAPGGVASPGPFAVTGSTSTLTNQVGDGAWLGPDQIHPNPVGSSLFASAAQTTYFAVANLSADWIAGANQKWIANRSRTVPRPYNGGYTQHRGTLGTVNLAGTSSAAPVHAMRYVFNEAVVIDRIGLEATVLGVSSILFAGIWIPEVSGSAPGALLTDFGLASANVTGSAGFFFVNGYQVLPPGEYWIGVAVNWHSGTLTLRALSTLNSDMALPHMAVPATDVNLLGYTNTVPVSGTEGTANITSMVVAGSWAEANTSVARVCVRHWSHAYQNAG